MLVKLPSWGPAAQLMRVPSRFVLLISLVLALAFTAGVREFSGDGSVFAVHLQGTHTSGGPVSADTAVSSGRPVSSDTAMDLDKITATAAAFAASAMQPPYKHQFWEAGQRSRRLAEWLGHVDATPRHSPAWRQLVAAVETAAASLFPFVAGKASSSNSSSSSSTTPLTDLRDSFVPGSRGIVVAVGGSDDAVRFAGHLIVALREVLKCTLAIQIAYAGDDDLPPPQRAALAALDTTNQTDFLDVWTVFDDATLRLAGAGWAIKPFGALASRFEQVVAVDADAVFLQPPEALFAQPAFAATGAYLFHDRLLWQHAFGERHAWWRDQIKEPSAELGRSLVWTQDYAEECDAGVVVLDKARPAVLAGLLHTAWQNTQAVRDEVSYKLTYGDKETWWLGLELAGSAYRFEEHYGSMLGWAAADTGDGRVCSFVIAHVDAKGALLWYNGSLLKNKLVNATLYEVPDAWMVDGRWEKGGAKQDMSCMVGAAVQRLTAEEQAILQRSMDGAAAVDKTLEAEGRRRGGGLTM